MANDRFKHLVLHALAMLLLILSSRSDVISLAEELESASQWT